MSAAVQVARPHVRLALSKRGANPIVCDRQWAVAPYGGLDLPHTLVGITKNVSRLVTEKVPDQQ